MLARELYDGGPGRGAWRSIRRRLGQRLLGSRCRKTGKEFAALGRATSPQKEAADLAYRNAMRELIAINDKAEPR